MLTSLWNQVIGSAKSSSEDDDESNTNSHFYSSPPPRSSRKSASPSRHNRESRQSKSRNSNQKPRSIETLQQTSDSEDDNLALSLLEKFPPYGSHSALIKKHPHNNHHLIGAGGAAGAAAAAAIAVNGSGNTSDPNSSSRFLSGSPTRKSSLKTGESWTGPLAAKNRLYYSDGESDKPHDDGDSGSMNLGTKSNKEKNIWSNNNELDIWKSTNRCISVSPTRRKKRYNRSRMKGGKHRTTIVGGSGSNHRHPTRDQSGKHSNNHGNKDRKKVGNKKTVTQDTIGVGMEKRRPRPHPHPHPYNQYPSLQRKNMHRRRTHHECLAEEHSTLYYESLRKQWISEVNHTSSSKITLDSAPDNISVNSGSVGNGSESGSQAQAHRNSKPAINPHRIRDAGTFTTKPPFSSFNSRSRVGTSNSSNDNKDNGVNTRLGQHFTFSFADDEDKDIYSSYEESTSSDEDYHFEEGYSDESNYSDDYDNGSVDDDKKDNDRLSRFGQHQPHHASTPPLKNNENCATNNSNGAITSVGGENQNSKGWYLRHKQNEEKQHWMPDELCKTCYACESQFNPFRRRHHCRLCGQVFCSRCSAFFVEIEDDRSLVKDVSGREIMSDNGMVRHGFESNGSSNSPSSITVTVNDDSRIEGVTPAAWRGQSNRLGGDGDTGRKRLPIRTIRTCKMCYDHASESHSGLVVSATVNTWFGYSSRGNMRKRGDDALNVIPYPENKNHQQALTSGSKSNRTTVSLGGNLPSFSSIDSGSAPEEAGTELINTANKHENGNKTESSHSHENEAKSLAIGTSTSNEFAYASIKEQLVEFKSLGSRDGFENKKTEKQNIVENNARGSNLNGNVEEEGRTSSFDFCRDDDDNYGINLSNRAGFSSKVSIIGKAKTPSSSTTRRFGRLAESAARENLVGDHGFNDDEVKLVGTGVSAPSEEEEKEYLSNNNDSYEKQKNIKSIPVIPSTFDFEERNGKHGNSGEPSTSGDTSAKEKGKRKAIGMNTVEMCAEAVNKANKRLGLCAASHLEKMGRELLRSEAPLLLEEKGIKAEDDCIGESKKVFDDWVSSLMIFATRCCATVVPNLRNGDMLDIRPYCKVKVIPGGELKDSAYISGIAFRKDVSHKAMSREISNPRIMLLSGGIEYTRTENKFASFDTLLEQESKYMEIIVTKITKLKPDVLMVGRSVNRKAQELLVSRTSIVLLQHVKVGLMEKIARQTGATILHGTNQIMNQFGSTVLGKCRRFRLVAFRDNELWHNDINTSTKIAGSNNPPNSIPLLLSQKDLPNHNRQAALAASLLGESVHSAQHAVRTGISKRGVSKTYGLIEGCPSHLGCTIVLRGASRSALKQVKRLFQFLINAAYNLKLETSYLRARRAKLPTTEYTIDPSRPTMSSSLCVDYGDPPVGRKVVRPWNGGGKGEYVQQSISGITALDHQSILISSVWMAGKTQCCPAELKGICYYSQQDVSLGQFLRDSCLNLQVKCPNLSCKKSVLEHSLSFIHNDGLINITVEKMDQPLPERTTKDSNFALGDSDQNDTNSTSKMKNKNPIATWSYCANCSKVVTPLNYLTEETWKLSFGKFLEVLFYNKEMRLNCPEHQCSCNMQSESTLFFGCGDLAARFTYERIRPYGVYLRRNLPSDDKFHRDFTFNELDLISNAAKELYSKFDTKVADVTRDTRQLFGGGSQYQQYQQLDQHQQLILLELNTISTEVKRASKILQEKITSVTNRFRASQQEIATSYGEGSRHKAQEAFMYFPWHSRRYLFLLASAWNDRLSTIGQALVAKRKLLSSTAQLYSSSINSGKEIGLGQTDGEADELMEAIQRIRQLRDVYSNLNVNDMSIQPTVKESLRYTKRNPWNGNSNNMDGIESIDANYDDFDEEFGVSGDNSGNLAAGNSEEAKFNFAEEVDADVMASRMRNRRHAQTIDQNPSNATNKGRIRSRSRSTGRAETVNDSNTVYSSRRGRRNEDHPSSRPPSRSRLSRSQSPSTTRSRPVTAGGAVKSAITRFFNRGSKEQDPYVVDLGIFSHGRPKLEPGIDGVVVPVFDDQPASIIAYSLSSVEYNAQFNHYSKSDLSKESAGETRRSSNSVSGESTTEDLSVVEGDLESSHRLKQDSHHRTAPRKRGRNQYRNSVQSTSSSSDNLSGAPFDERKSIERRMLVRNKTHIKHTFRDHDEKGQQIAKFVCTTYWATQFQAVRHAFLKDSGAPENTSSGGNSGNTQTRFASERVRAAIEKGYNKSLSTSNSWAVSGGKSGANFSKTSDDRFIVKCISRTELQMFLDCAPAYFKYVSKAFFQGLPTMLSKIVGVYQIGYHNRVTGKRTMEQVAVMQNIFYKRKISKVFDLKGTLNRFAKRTSSSEKEKNDIQQTAATNVDVINRKDRRGNIEASLSDNDSTSKKDGGNRENSSSSEEDTPTTTDNRTGRKITFSTHSKKSTSDNDNGINDKESDSTMLDGDFMEFTGGRPLPLNDRAKATFHMSILNDTLFLTIINVLDYSILVGIDEERNELVVGIIDFMRQYDILKQMERVGKSIPMVVGSEAPTIIQPPLYKARFINAMTRYFMTVPSKWTTI